MGACLRGYAVEIEFGNEELIFTSYTKQWGKSESFSVHYDGAIGYHTTKEEVIDLLRRKHFLTNKGVDEIIKGLFTDDGKSKITLINKEGLMVCKECEQELIDVTKPKDKRKSVMCILPDCGMLGKAILGGVNLQNKNPVTMVINQLIYDLENRADDFVIEGHGLHDKRTGTKYCTERWRVVQPFRMNFGFWNGNKFLSAVEKWKACHVINQSLIAEQSRLCIGGQDGQ